MVPDLLLNVTANLKQRNELMDETNSSGAWDGSSVKELWFYWSKWIEPFNKEDGLVWTQTILIFLIFNIVLTTLSFMYTLLVAPHVCPQLRY